MTFKHQFQFPPKEERGGPVHEFLYLNHPDGVRGAWTWGQVGNVNGALLWPNALAYFIERILAGATRVLGWIQKKGEAWLTAAGPTTLRYVQNVVSAWQFAQAGGQPTNVLRASFTEPYGPLAFLPAAFEQEAETVETAFTDIGLPEPLAAAMPVLLPLGLLGLGVILLATRQRPRQATTA